MRYQVRHITEYKYDFPASLCHNLIFQTPQRFAYQEVESHDCKIDPEPSSFVRRKDFFENEFLYFSLHKTHQKLKVTSSCKVALSQPVWMQADASATVPWEVLASELQTPKVLNDIRQYYLESPYVPVITGVKDYALASFTPHRPIMEAVLELNTRINKDFKFTPGFTEISTPLKEVFKEKKGVCQDFAHFGLSCLRSLGLAARYMSGYIETIPAPGQKKMVGADASHAWIAVYIPPLGWVEFDSTNNLLVSDQHVRVAVGRDFGDVVPMKGIVYSGGGQEMEVKVDVNRLAD
ncbi:MAG: transglutaminase family protein [Bacteroidota bacterium]